MGFCDGQFPLEKEWLGSKINTIFDIDNKIWIDGSRVEFENAISSRYFEKGDFAGLGLIRQPDSKMECFVSSNGKLISKIKYSP